MKRVQIAVATALVFLASSGCDDRTELISSSVDTVVLSFDGADAESSDAQRRHGKRLAALLGCTGCHKSDFSGGPFNEGWIAPNLSLLASDYDKLTLDKAVRQGIALDGRKIKMMPTEMYQSLSNADMSALSSYLLAIEPSGVPQPVFEPLPSDVEEWEAIGYTDGNTLGLEWASSPGPLALGREHARGRYLAMNLCTECHNNQLQGYPGFTPDLSIIASYNDQELRTLLHDGKGNVRSELGLMTMVSPARFPHLTDDEYDELTKYLRARSKAISGQ